MAKQIRFDGKCNKCGGCCYQVKVSFMIDETGVCQFLTDDNLCAIRGRTIVPTDEQLEYWRANCDNYPQMMTKQDPERVLVSLKRLGWPTKTCGYKLVVFDG